MRRLDVVTCDKTKVNNSSKVNKLTLKIRYLKAELDECQQIYDEAKIEFFNSAVEKKDKLGIEDDEVSNEFLNDDRDIEVSQSDDSGDLDDINHTDADKFYENDIVEKPPWVKKIFRKIALMTHPDKVPQSLDKTLKEKLIGIYKKAAESYKSDNYINLLESAGDLGVDFTVDDDEFILFLRDEITALEKKILEIKSSAIWQWTHADDDVKSDIMNIFANIRGWNNRPDEEE